MKDCIITRAEIGGRSRVALERKNDFHALTLNGTDYEYALARGGSKFDRGEKDALPSLAAALNKAVMKPREPLEGWVRFEIKGILPPKLADNRSTYQVVVVDSQGNDYPITKASTLKREGEIGIRQQRVS